MQNYLERPFCAVIVNGVFSHAERLLPLLDQAEWIIAADGGANWLFSQGRTPHLLIGDLDSVSPSVLQELERSGCPIRRYPTAKDETDTELALLEAAQRSDRILVLGALGGRIDHELANILLLSMPQLGEKKVILFDGRSFIFLLRGSGSLRGCPGDTISLLPLGGDVEGIETEGLEYPLHNETLFFGPARGISNVLLAEEAHITFQHGLLLVIHTPQEYLEG
ncbi:MAG: thiamine diphosphokinase [Anaerolineae bacterium]|nr:thiamine diphosphokinase [Anaerolineae bacterium]